MSQSPLPAIIVSTFYMHPFLFVLIQTTRNCVILCSAGGQALVSVKTERVTFLLFQIIVCYRLSTWVVFHFPWNFLPFS